VAFCVVDMAGRCYSLSLVQQVVMCGELGMCGGVVRAVKLVKEVKKSGISGVSAVVGC